MRVYIDLVKSQIGLGHFGQPPVHQFIAKTNRSAHLR